MNRVIQLQSTLHLIIDHWTRVLTFPSEAFDLKNAKHKTETSV